MFTKRLLLTTALAFAGLLTNRGMLAEEVRGTNSPYYEDDAWYDVSEWFDGNDYNPTDEAIGRWDDEIFHFDDKATSGDSKKFMNWGDHGYADSTPEEERWFFDYYDDGSAYWDTYDGWNTYTVYSDTDDDGVYDTYSYYKDGDSDGHYEDFDAYRFDSNARAGGTSTEIPGGAEKELKSGLEDVRGIVEKTKLVNVRDRIHLIASLKSANGEPIMVDLGPKQLSTQLFAGDQLSVKGRRVKIGDKSVIVATAAQSKDADVTIDRNGRKYQGEVQSTRDVAIRGTTHVMAKLKTQNGKSMMLDLGPIDNLTNRPQKGDSVSVQGVPVKVKDRVLLMVRTLDQNGTKSEIRRDR